MSFASDLIPFVGEAIAVASLITALTPTPADDKILGKVYKVIEAVGLNVGKAKEQPPRPKRKK